MNQLRYPEDILQSRVKWKRMSFTEVVVDSAPLDEDSLNSVPTTEVPREDITTIKGNANLFRLYSAADLLHQNTEQYLNQISSIISL